MTPKEGDMHGTPTPEEERAAQAVRSLDGPRMDAAFRAGLRERFVSGTLGESARGESPGRRRGAVIPLVGLAVAATAAFVVWMGSAVPHWTYGGAMGETGELWVCGMLMDPGEPESIDAMLHAGTPVRTKGDLQVDLVLHDRLSLQLAPESEVTVPEWPKRWFGGAAACEVSRGEVRFATGPRYDERLEVRSPLAVVEVTGTTLAVISGADSSCVCVLEGEVRMTDADGSVHLVEEGSRRTVYREGSPVVEEIFPQERMKLEMLRDSVACP